MSDKTPQPNRDNSADFDDLNDLDVPTYKGKANKPGPDIYQRTGRAAPERIEPTTPAASGKGGREQTPQTPLTETISMNRSEPVAQSSTDKTEFYTTDFDYSSKESANAGNEAYANTAAARPADAASVQAATATSYLDSQQVDVEQPTAGQAALKEARRGTIDFGLLLLRLLLGGFLILESVQTFFQLGAAGGLAGLETEFTNYAYGNILAIGLPTAQLAAGVFLVLGLLTPVAAMVATVATGFVALHALYMSGAGLNLFNWTEAIWLALILFGISVVLQFTGPGIYSFDTGRGWARRPLASSWIFIVLGIAALVAVWIFGTGINPFA
nr:DoxX family protein [Corynebacterium lubricantis]